MKKKEFLNLLNTIILFHKKIYIIDVDEWHLYFENDKYYFEICAPHSGTDNKWMFRKGRKKDFDRWANSTNEESFYETIGNLEERLIKKL